MTPYVISERSQAHLAPLEGPGPSLDFPDAGIRRIHRTGTPERILLVEDDWSIRAALTGILEEEGYVVTTASNGRQALERLRSSSTPDLIVLDLRMPIMDGWEFRAAQKSDPELARIPVVAVSADGSAQAAAIDAQAYLRKPLSTETFLNAIGRVLGEADRQQLRGRLEEAERFAALGRLAASVGHEINNPLAYVLMNVDLAINQLERYLGGGVQGGFAADLASLPPIFRECRVGLERIREVVRDLQRLSRRSDLKREAFSINDLLDESLAMARNQIEHVAQVRKFYNSVPEVVGDRSALGQVLLNLLLNAAQALPQGHADTNTVTVSTYGRGMTVVAEIGDTGSGIPLEVLPHIFDPFFTTKPIGEGTGLGLAVSFRIVADHGGRIIVESDVDRGSVFRVELPVAPPTTREAVREQHPQAEPKIARARILVIDDMPALGRSLARLLKEHEVTVVERAKDAFARLAANETFDVVLCDLMMPESSGREVFERLRAEWPALASRVIFMTGGAFTPESREFLAQSPQPTLTKPFSLDELRAVLGELMKEHPDDGPN